jgi:phosphopentomutase
MRSVLIILDGLGVGAMPDAAEYGDLGHDTLGNMSSHVGGVSLPNLQRLGLGNLHKITGVPPVDAPVGAYGRMAEISKGKDSTTGHWELMNVVTDRPYPTYPDGFPQDVLDAFTKATGYGVIGNKAASGTHIIKELGDEHVETGKLIVYTSADSVFQIAAHEDIVPLEELYRVCQIARDMLVPPHEVSRVIARPFVGGDGDYLRTPNRHDYSIVPPDSLLLPKLQQRGVKIHAIGKIFDLYAGAGIHRSYKSKNNAQGMKVLKRVYRDAEDDEALLLLNLVDFDMLWGHRNDPQGMAGDLEAFDEY